MKLKDEIENLKQMVLKMGDVVVDNIDSSINNYLGKTNELVNDDIVDKFERLIEEMCLTILLRERPYASDLKEVTGILKLVSDLERIGDHAEDIITFTNKLKEVNIRTKHLEAIDNLAQYVLNMLKNSIKAYINSDTKLAQEIIDSDDYVDNKYDEIVESLAHIESKEQGYLPFAIYSTLVVKYLERIADHSVNIAEWVIYIVSGFYKDKKIY